MRNIPGSTLDPLGYELGAGIGEGLFGLGRQYTTHRDRNAIGNFIASRKAPMMMPGVGGVPILTDRPAQPFPEMWSPWGRRQADLYTQSQLASLMPPGPLDLARIENLRAGAERDRAYAETLRNPTVEPDPYSVPHLVRNLGFTPKEAIEARNIHYGLAPRASSARPETALDRLNTLSTLYQKTLDPAWGERMPELHGLGDIVLGEIGTLTDELQQAGVSTTLIDKAKEPKTISPPKPVSRAQIAGELAKLHQTEHFPVPIPKIVTKYPKLAEKMLSLTPAERAEILAAIQADMSEADILKYVR